MKLRHLGFSLLLLIVLVGGFLRIYNIGSAPPSLNWDEAAWGYNAYSIMETGRDEYGKILPIFTRSFDEYKSTLPMYLMIPTIKIFGLNEVGVRLPSVIIGSFTILLIYFLTKEMLGSQKVSLLAASVYALEPWAVHLSRVYYDASEALFFLLLGLLIFLKAKKKNILLPLSLASFIISMYTYNSDKVLVPIFLTALVFLNRKWLGKVRGKVRNLSLTVLTVFMLPFIYLAFIGEVFARVSTTNIFVLWPDLLKPKIYYFAWEIFGRYLSYFSPMNLFLREPLEPSTVVAGNSVFYLFEFIFWVIGLFYLFKNHKKYRELFWLVLISPLPAVVTWNWFQPGRTLALFAAFSIVIGVGLSRILKSTVAYILLVGFLVVTSFYLFDSINVYSPYRDNGNYQPGFRETVPEVMKLEGKYSQVIIDTPQGQPYIFYLFYGKYDPTRYLSELDLDYIGTPRKHFDFGKFHFRKINWDDDKNLKNTLFVGSPGDFPDTTPSVVVKNKFGDTINWLVASG